MKKRIYLTWVHMIVMGIIFCIVIFVPYLANQIETSRMKKEIIRKNSFP